MVIPTCSSQILAPTRCFETTATELSATSHAKPDSKAATGVRGAPGLTTIATDGWISTSHDMWTSIELQSPRQAPTTTVCTKECLLPAVRADFPVSRTCSITTREAEGFGR